MAQIFAMIVRTLMVKFRQMVSKGWLITSVWCRIRPRLLLFSCMFAKSLVSWTNMQENNRSLSHVAQGMDDHVCLVKKQTQTPAVLLHVCPPDFTHLEITLV